MEKSSYLKILAYARESNATNLHLAAGAVPHIRVEGKLHPTAFPHVTPEDTKQIVEELLSADEKEKLDSKHFLSLPISFKGIGRARANIYLQRSSYSINFKLLDRLVKTPEELGIPDVVMDLAEQKNGLILVCGSRYSGISTTRAALVKRISETRDCVIITVEDPIEYLFKHDKAIVNQKEIGIDAANFPEGIYSAMQQDADVIMISNAGEPETFAAVLDAAEHGHLVIASLHTVGTVETIRYIYELFPAEKRNRIKMQLANTLQAITSQQLIPKKQGGGSVLAMEVMLATRAVRNLIFENKFHQIPDVIKANKMLGMMSMKDSLTALHSQGLISKEEVLNYSL
ncbi:MAG: PilT/PilU family type 4a pilus ATPase [Firmicutes bacterium]|nr:PilT/PilU family type 4a pilus ATPase [Bacillota bacterium]